MSSFPSSLQFPTEHSYVPDGQGLQPRQYVFNVIPNDTSPYPDVASLSPDSIDTPSPSSSQYDEPTAVKGSSRRKNHIPRPLNSYFIFRKDIIDKKIITKDTENDSRHLSRIIGELWNNLSSEEKECYDRRAEDEKIKHQDRYPNYVYQPRKRTTPPKKRNAKRNSPEDINRSKGVAHLLSAGKTGSDLEGAVKQMSATPQPQPQPQAEVEPQKKRVSEKRVPPPAQSPPGPQGWEADDVTHQVETTIPSTSSLDESAFSPASFESEHMTNPCILNTGYYDASAELENLLATYTNSSDFTEVDSYDGIYRLVSDSWPYP
ncbi:uncharacterized protein BT62DRAFT_1001522 [Guyanagaster necrorhizus]|uniref:HMG box domain-containing protein n=1 Tax=Guyanagaster necrorhizus TaxID=856835 RepID=A0A9P7W3Q2_9AGAR|nr:uncharacterized protein BT62DRAFT_1001522 [Guyanagaster necrorhizus MCA 3950]KAG7450731.1 hypothetical protein BT62DRAFT_1001522 [Guyanagaster necrorhizus MCA 3950]